MTGIISDDVGTYMRASDIAVFKSVARRFNIFIAVRRTNPESLKYVGEAGYEPKQLNCKFKTADRDADIEGQRRRLAGLVVNPRISGMEAAFGREKYDKCIEIWDEYAPALVWQEGDPVSSSKPYLVETDTRSKHYGALKSGYYHSRVNAKYIHGDYDLYDIVDAARPRQHVVVREKLYDNLVKHVRGQKFNDVQNNLNVGIGVPMVRHGSQAGFSDFTEDDIDVFFPDGETVKKYLGEQAIRRLYSQVFQGRGHIHKDTEVQAHSGLWIRPTRRDGSAPS